MSVWRSIGDPGVIPAVVRERGVGARQFVLFPIGIAFHGAICVSQLRAKGALPGPLVLAAFVALLVAFWWYGLADHRFALERDGMRVGVGRRFRRYDEVRAVRAESGMVYVAFGTARASVVVSDVLNAEEIAEYIGLRSRGASSVPSAPRPR